MQTTKDVRGQCQHCGGQFDFPAEHAGMVAPCPHCGQETELLLATPLEETSPVRKKAIIFASIAIVILGIGIIAPIIALKRAQRLAGKQTTQTPTAPSPAPQAANPFAEQEFRASDVTLEKTPGSKLVYAQGTIVNLAKRQRFGVKVEVDLFDADGRRIATARDYTGTVEPNGEWKFHASVLDPKAASAKLATIKEQ